MFNNSKNQKFDWNIKNCFCNWNINFIYGINWQIKKNLFFLKLISVLAGGGGGQGGGQGGGPGGGQGGGGGGGGGPGGGILGSLFGGDF